MAKKKRKKKIPLKKLLRRLEKKADKAFSEYVRASTRKEYGNLCPLCQKKPIQCCFHFVSRRRKIVRLSLRNTVGTCHTCNYIENYFSDLSRYWYIKRYGVDQYLLLVEEATKDFIPTQEFLEHLILTFKNKLSELK